MFNENLYYAINSMVNILLIAFLVIAILFIIALIIVGLIRPLFNEKKYQKDVLTVLKGTRDHNEIERQVKQIYSVYSTKMASYQSVDALNNRLIEKIKDRKIDSRLTDKNIVYYTKVLNELNQKFAEDELYSDDKLKTLLEKINDKEVKEEFKLMVYCVNNYNRGRLYEKDMEITTLKEKKKKSIIFSCIGYAVGFVGLISSIVTIFHL